MLLIIHLAHVSWQRSKTTFLTRCFFTKPTFPRAGWSAGAPLCGCVLSEVAGEVRLQAGEGVFASVQPVLRRGGPLSTERAARADQLKRGVRQGAIGTTRGKG